MRPLAGLLLILCLTSSGCSVVMALHGKRQPNMAALHIGSTREQVEQQLGQPIETIPSADGRRTDVYQYERGNEPSTARAVIYAIYDLLTLGIFELFATIAESSQGETVRVPIVYSADDRVLGINEYASDTAVATVPAASTREPGPSRPVLSDVDDVPSLTSRRKAGAYAVVVGIEQYREKLPKADYADRDARAVADYLTKVLGFPEEDVVVRLNERAARTDLEKYLEGWLPNHVEKDDSVFIYFSGHGAPNPKTGEAYLVPYDGDPAFLEATAYPLKRLYQQAAKLPAKEVIVVLDSCFSGAGGRSVLAKGARPMVLSVENPLMASQNTAVLAASAADQISNTYDEKGHGLLTYYFLKGLKGEADRDADGRIDLRELFEYLQPQVQRVARRQFNSEQSPQLIGPADLIRKGLVLRDR